MEILYKRGYVEYHSSLYANVLKDYNLEVPGLRPAFKNMTLYLLRSCKSNLRHALRGGGASHCQLWVADSAGSACTEPAELASSGSQGLTQKSLLTISRMDTYLPASENRAFKNIENSTRLSSSPRRFLTF